MRIMAVRQIAGDYGVLGPGETHPNVADHIATELINNGLAVEAVKVEPCETQVMVPVEVPVRIPDASIAGPSENKSEPTRRGRS